MTESNSNWGAEPYRVFFPAGIVLAWVGVAHWIGFAFGWSHAWEPVLHSIVQIEGFMTCFAFGFLLTAIPRRTGTRPPGNATMALMLAGPFGTCAAAWFGAFAWAQVFWCVGTITLVVFVVRRFRDRTAQRRPPVSFVWIPLSLLMGFAGTVCVGVYGVLAARDGAATAFEWHDFGKLLLLQGVFLGLVVGVGGMVLPLITCGDAPPDENAADGRQRLLHVGAAAVLVTTFALEAFGGTAWDRVAYTSRGVLVLALLVGSGRIWRWPQRPGFHRRLVWISAWAIPIGYLLTAVLPLQLRQAGLHTVFLGGFALMALAVGLHVSFAHGGRQDLTTRSPRGVLVLAAAFAFAWIARGLVAVDPERMRMWLGSAGIAFAFATVVWLVVVARARRGAAPEATGAAGHDMP